MTINTNNKGHVAVIGILLTMNGYFINRLVNSLDLVIKGQSDLANRVTVLETTLKIKNTDLQSFNK